MVVAQSQPAPPGNLQLPASANELVQQTIANELKEVTPSEHFEYRDEKQTPSGSTTREVVETSDGNVGRLILVNNEPPSAQQRGKDDARLQKLISDPQAQAKFRKDQKDDQQRVQKMLSSMPSAFVYRYDGAQESPDGPVVRLHFTPNPQFNPPNRETEIFKGMEGTMLINAREKRLVEMAGNLIQNVNFGWGIFGHLDRGGYFVVKQSKIAPDRWETTETRLKFTGRALVFHKINIDEKDTESDFHPAPNNLTIAKAIEYLKHQSTEVAQQSTTNAQGQR